jgi:hypothetical protein
VGGHPEGVGRRRNRGARSASGAPLAVSALLGADRYSPGRALCVASKAQSKVGPQRQRAARRGAAGGAPRARRCRGAQRQSLKGELRIAAQTRRQRRIGTRARARISATRNKRQLGFDGRQRRGPARVKRLGGRERNFLVWAAPTLGRRSFGRRGGPLHARTQATSLGSFVARLTSIRAKPHAIARFFSLLSSVLWR